MAQQPQPIQPDSDYTIQTGDTLWDIAERAYGDREDWGTIYNANKRVIGNNPNLIHLGQVLHIPLQSDPNNRQPPPTTLAPSTTPPPPTTPKPPTTLPPPVGLNNGQSSVDLGQPSPWVVNFIWITIILVFAIVFVMSAVAIVVSVWSIAPAKGTSLGDAATLVTVFSTAVGFLAGVLTPNPVGKAGAAAAKNKPKGQ